MARKIYDDDHKHFLSGMCFSFVYFILPKFQGPEFSFLSRNNKRNRTELVFSIKEYSIVKWIEIHIHGSRARKTTQLTWPMVSSVVIHQMSKIEKQTISIILTKYKSIDEHMIMFKKYPQKVTFWFTLIQMHTVFLSI